MSGLFLQPISFKEAHQFVLEHHRHNDPAKGYKFGIAVNDGEKVVGVATVGRPIARHKDDGWTAEVTRVCVLEGYKNASSMLYGACWRAARAMGYHRIITYTLITEPGTSLKAAGWKVIGETTPIKAPEIPNESPWDRNGRPRVVTGKYPMGQKTIWESQ